jgi:hypothetical protein
MPDEKPHVSATQLEMFWKCPEQYRRRYIEGERIPPGVALLVGGAFHRGAEHNFRQKIESHEDLPEKDIVEAAVAAFEAAQAGGCMFSDDEASRGAKLVLGDAKDLTAKIAGVHAELQAPDYQPVVVEHTTRIVFPDLTHDLLGVTDLRDDQRRVIDFKTAGRKMNANAAHISTQLTIYAAAHQIETGDPPSEVRFDVVTKTKTPARQVLASDRTVEDFEVLANRVNETVKAIKTGIFPPASPDHWVCDPKWCGYARTCKFFCKRHRH